jgi:chromosome segregation ATPase
MSEPNERDFQVAGLLTTVMGLGNISSQQLGSNFAPILEAYREELTAPLRLLAKERDEARREQAEAQSEATEAIHDLGAKLEVSEERTKKAEGEARALEARNAFLERERDDLRQTVTSQAMEIARLQTDIEQVLKDREEK